MIPTNCIVKHDPPHSFGDCLRACVASILELPSNDVPHFAEDNCDGETMVQRIRNFLEPMNLAPVFVSYDGAITLEELLLLWKSLAGETHSVLFCYSGGSDHAVIISNGKVVHNPAWYRSPIEGATTLGFWQIMVLARK